jgi:hypothetical protein
MEYLVKKSIALVAVLSTLVLSGCGNINVAAKLGDITITQTQLQDSVNEILTEREAVDTSQMQLQTGADLSASELRFKIIVVVFEQIAKELKIKVTNSDLLKMRSTLIEQVGGEANLVNNLVMAQIPSSEFETYVRAIVLSSKLEEALKASGVADADIDAKLSQLIVAKSKSMGVTVNPRYGAWDPESTSLTMIDAAATVVQPSGQ